MFAMEEKEQGEVKEVWHEIITEDSPPVRQAPQCVPFASRSEVSQLVGVTK